MRYECRYDQLKADRVLMAMAADQERQPNVVALSVGAIANLVGAAPADLPPVLANLERQGIVFRDPLTGQYSLAPISRVLALERSRGREPVMVAPRETSTA